MNKNNYLNTLKKYRTKCGYTQQQVADMLEVESTSRLSQWEQGSSYPNIENLFKLCLLYNTPPETLYRPLFNSLKRKYQKYFRFSVPKKEYVSVAKMQPPSPPSISMTEDQSLDYLAKIIVDLYLYNKKNNIEM